MLNARSYGCDCSGCDCVGDQPCPPTCFEATCDDWATDYGTTCSYLEDTYTCDCEGCNCQHDADTTVQTTFSPCPATCYGNTCEELRVSTGQTYEYMETNLGCNCAGCTTTSTTTGLTTTTTTTVDEYTGLPTTTIGACPSTCFNFDCDTLIPYGYTCAQLESDSFNCDCGGCSCVTTTTSTSTSTTTTSTTTTVLNACGLRIVNDYYYLGASGIDYCVDFNVVSGSCPGCESVQLANDEVAQIHFENTAMDSLFITTDVDVYDACDLESATEITLNATSAYNFDASDYEDGVYYIMSGAFEFGVVSFCDQQGQKFRIIVGTVADGCMNATACNYNASNVVDTQDACTFPPEGLSCNGTCLVEFDQCGVCNGDGVGANPTGVDVAFLEPNHTSSSGTGIVGGCLKRKWVGDGACDDGNNNCMCGWDGGDCCGTNTTYVFCSACDCLDPSFIAPAPAYCQRACWKSAFAGDNFCDDRNNVCGCDWDGGDCCGDANNYNFCDSSYTDVNGNVVGCACLDPEFVVPAPAPSDGCVTRCPGTCAKPAFAGDGICDDTNNICGCDWDGGGASFAFRVAVVVVCVSVLSWYSSHYSPRRSVFYLALRF